MTAGLAAQQHAILAALFAPKHEEAAAHMERAEELEGAASQWQRGLLAYRSNAGELAQRALAGAYPVTATLLGEANFAPLSRELWRAHPPRRGDLAQWGEALAAFVETLPALFEQEPYLPDVARIEWQLHVAATARDAQPEPASLALLTQIDPAQLVLALAPGVAALSSRFPAASILLAHTEETPGFDMAAAKLRADVAEDAIVWRRGLKPCVRVALPGEAKFVQALQEAHSLADSLQATGEFDFGAWLPLAVSSGLLLAVRRL
jgi:hypothetical protein